jgi:hypothetical protein
MKKALFIMALYIVPFFSLSQNADNIFYNGDVDTQAPEFSTFLLTSCYSSRDGIHPNNVIDQNSCMSWISSTHPGERYDPDYNQQATRLERWANFCRSTTNNDTGVVDECGSWSPAFIGSFRFTGGSVESQACPPDAHPSFVLPILDETGDNIKFCVDPFQLSQVDDCNSNSSHEYLTIPVTSSDGCVELPDGSMCAYNSVDIGGGNDYYAMDLEGECYSNPNDLPEIDFGLPEDDPIDDDCVSYGNGVLGCPENPSNVCDSGSSFSGGSIQDCQTGCGMVNSQFMCIDEDTDNDGIPDYNDPDIDGDGIQNEDDLDNNGDGLDDPINENPSNENSDLNLGPLINEIKKTNDSLDAIEDSFKTDHGLTSDGINKDGRLDELNNDYQLNLEEFIAKGSTEMGYTDKLTLGNSSSLSSLPSNACSAHSFHVDGVTIPFDMCVVAEKVKSVLFYIIGFLTAWHIFFLINSTLRGPI